MRTRRGFTLIETLVALIILVAVVLAMAMGTTRLQRSIGDSNIRTRAFARADVQIALARTWPTWTTLPLVAGATYNGTRDGLVTSTTVTTINSESQRIHRVAVTVSSQVPGALPTPVRRSISIAAP
jgi:prepilin-type N-terminal cleavage/methylation domain-containing protein